jgi:hypothetical protein
MALLALILASSLNQAAVAPDVRVVTVDRAPWNATACDPQLDAKFVHIPKPTPTLQAVHVTQGEATACLQRGPLVGKRIAKQRANAPPLDNPVRPIEQDPQAPPP